MASIINSFAIAGIEGYMVEIETDTIYGQPSVSIIGLGDRATQRYLHKGTGYHPTFVERC